MSNTESRKADLAAKVHDIHVERKKHVVWIVSGSKDTCGVTYTSGCVNYRIPDLFIPGNIGPVGGGILSALVDAMRERRAADPNDKLEGVFTCDVYQVNGQDMRLRLDVATIAQAMALGCHGAFSADLPDQRHFRLVHLPDAENRLPDEEGHIALSSRRTC